MLDEKVSNQAVIPGRGDWNHQGRAAAAGHHNHGACNGGGLLAALNFVDETVDFQGVPEGIVAAEEEPGGVAHVEFPSQS